MITGVHAIVFAGDAERTRAFVADALGLESVDAGGGWLIFALPPAELAVHPTDEHPHHELYLMCDDIHATVSELKAKGVEFATNISEQRWGLTTTIAVPGGGQLGLYEPRHPSPLCPTDAS
jgi:catechol 2,3-dioxygenase-like lactoylglutathione lyase family enzyme